MPQLRHAQGQVERVAHATHEEVHPPDEDKLSTLGDNRVELVHLLHEQLHVLATGDVFAVAVVEETCAAVEALRIHLLGDEAHLRKQPDNLLAVVPSQRLHQLGVQEACLEGEVLHLTIVNETKPPVWTQKYVARVGICIEAAALKELVPVHLDEQAENHSEVDHVYPLIVHPPSACELPDGAVEDPLCAVADRVPDEKVEVEEKHGPLGRSQRGRRRRPAVDVLAVLALKVLEAPAETRCQLSVLLLDAVHEADSGQVVHDQHRLCTQRQNGLGDGHLGAVLGHHQIPNDAQVVSLSPIVKFGPKLALDLLHERNVLRLRQFRKALGRRDVCPEPLFDAGILDLHCHSPAVSQHSPVYLAD
mmetsp:Transcript_9192/g.27673  ORF Transcript_9192/g.27673 Transcript_9192/m.27673 type:complete len:362 (+) Transcript_9192:120-1205(+)